ncbi:tyrosine-type recombinase/integrase [Acetatifactor muris]|uniref:tyrosine-type recombinase/integrase n=1 Tax=Acetatifactor muris TaxID=879566 RepID=UPI0023F09161|nr:site-specific integrase [Acetatifactor muris]
MASLKRVTHKNGRVVYRIVICMGYDKQGNKMVRNFTCSVSQSATFRQQEKEALKYALELEDRLKSGNEHCDNRLLFEDFSRKWLENVKDTLAYGTYVGYEQLLRSKILPYFNGYKIAHIRTSDIEAFYRTLTDIYSPGTIRRYANVLNCIFGTAKRWNIIADNPCQNALKPKQKQETAALRYFTPEQSLIFLKSLDMVYETKYGKKEHVVPLQYRVFFTLSIFCGFRKGEILALHWEDIFFDTLEISISKSIGKTERGFGYKKPKTPAAVRKVPFPDRLFSLLEEYRKEYELLRLQLGTEWQGKDNLFIRSDGRLMGHSTAYQYFVKHLKYHNQWVRKYPVQAKAAGIEELPLIPLHGLRHSCATLLNYLNVNIVDISKYLGHTNCSTTMNIYAHSFEAQKRVVSSKLNEFIRANC